MMQLLIIAAFVIWGIPLAGLVIAGVAASLSPRARDYLRRTLIAD